MEARRIAAPHMLDQLRALGDRRVGRPVEHRAGIAVSVEMPQLVRRIKGLVGAESLDLQEPVVLVRVAFQKLQSQVKGLFDRPGVLAPVPLPVLPVGRPPFGMGHLPHGRHMLRDIRSGALIRPLVGLLASHGLPARIPGMVGRAAVLPIVVVVADQPGIDAVVLQDLGHGIVEGLDRTPAPVQERVTSRMDISSGRHAGEAGRVEPIELCRSLRKTSEMGRAVELTPVRLQKAPVERVKHDHDRSHIESRVPF